MLEMVLALPILLFVMALMVDFGAASSWKIRGLIVARHTAWASRAPRTPAAFPPPIGSVGIAGFALDFPDHAQHLDDLSALHRPVARGPLPLGNRVDVELLNCNRGLRTGRATVEREFPLLSKLGPYRLEPRTEVLGDPWQFDDMGLADNGQRRIPVIYDLVKAPASLSAAYFNAARAILNPQLQWALRALDHDDEFLAMGLGTAFDFHPALGAMCTKNHDVVRQAVEFLKKRIADVPENLARQFREMYERLLQEGRDDSALRAKVQALDQFLEALQQSKDNN
jgi:hypothetical protein